MGYAGWLALWGKWIDGFAGFGCVVGGRNGEGVCPGRDGGLVGGDS